MTLTRPSRWLAVPSLCLTFACTSPDPAGGGDGADELFAGYDSFLAHPLGVALGLVVGAF